MTPERIAELLALDVGTPTRWMVGEKLLSGSTRWFAVEHEHHARSSAATERGAAVIPLYDAPVPDLHAALAQVVAENERLREALTPSGDTKYAYTGEFSWTEWLPDENGIEQGHVHTVPWDTIKGIMKAISNRALNPENDDAI